MGLIATRAGTRAALLLLALVAIGAGVDVAAWRQALALQARLAEPVEQAPADDAPPLLRLAHARWLGEHGETDAALNLYRRLQGDPRIGAVARFDAANLLMRRALVVRESATPGQALALIELAKQGYRELLRADPQHWGARYNLERAQRLLPEPEDADPSIAEPRNDAERAATTMRGVAPGLP